MFIYLPPLYTAGTFKVGTGFPQNHEFQVHDTRLGSVCVVYNTTVLLNRENGKWKNNKQYIEPNQLLNARNDINVDKPAKTKYFRLVTRFRSSLPTTTLFREHLQKLTPGQSQFELREKVPSTCKCSQNKG